MRPFFLTALSTLLAFTTAHAAPPPTDLFNGHDLTGWHQVNGTATYEAKDGMIIGTTAPGSPNSFLATDQYYRDFILDLDFKCDEPLNSGVQIRSFSDPNYKNGMTIGYQVEIDPAQKQLYNSTTKPNLHADGTPVPPNTEPRRWSGGIQEERRRGWLADLTHNEPARNAFKPDQWNHFHIEAQADTMKVWLNDTPSATLTDNLIPTGFIALQVHAVKSPTPYHVYFKNLKLQVLTPSTTQPTSSTPPAPSKSDPK